MNRDPHATAADVTSHVWRAFPDLYRASVDEADGYMIAAEHVGHLLDAISSADSAADRRYVRASVSERVNELSAVQHPTAAISGALAAYRRALDFL